MREIIAIADGELPPVGSKFLYSSVQSRQIPGQWKRSSNFISEFLSGREQFRRNIYTETYTVHYFEVGEPVEPTLPSPEDALRIYNENSSNK